MELFEGLGLRESREEWVVAAMALLSTFVLMLAARAIAPRTQRLRYGAALLCLIVAVVSFVMYHLVSWPGVRSFLGGIAALFYSIAVARIVFVLGFDAVLARNLREPIPRIFRDISQGLLLFIAILISLHALGVEPGQLLTTSALLTVVAGMALQETLGNLVAGLALQGERPFEVGDWIEYHGAPGHIGKVREINWRATRLHTLDNIDVVVPNGLLAKATVTNYDRPHRAARRSIYFHASYQAPPRRVHDVVVPAVIDAPGVLKTPAPSLVTFAFDESGVNYWLRFFIDDMGRRDAIDGGVRDRVWYSLERAGIELSVPHRSVALHEESEASELAKQNRRIKQRLASISKISLFAPLGPADMRQLAKDARSEMFAAGEVVIRQGERGDTMFVVKNGELVVRIAHGAGLEIEAEHLGPGSFFGEMSLLTGEPRNATVIAATSCKLLVIDHASFKRLFDAHPEVANAISEKVVERRHGLMSLTAQPELKQKVEVEERALINRIRGFFGF